VFPASPAYYDIAIYVLRVVSVLCAAAFIFSGKARVWPVFTWWLVAVALKVWVTHPLDRDTSLMERLDIAVVGLKTGATLEVMLRTTVALGRRRRSMIFSAALVLAGFGAALMTYKYDPYWNRRLMVDDGLALAALAILVFLVAFKPFLLSSTRRHAMLWGIILFLPVLIDSIDSTNITSWTRYYVLSGGYLYALSALMLIWIVTPVRWIMASVGAVAGLADSRCGTRTRSACRILAPLAR